MNSSLFARSSCRLLHHKARIAKWKQNSLLKLRDERRKPNSADCNQCDDVKPMKVDPFMESRRNKPLGVHPAHQEDCRRKARDHIFLSLVSTGKQEEKWNSEMKQRQKSGDPLPSSPAAAQVP